MKFTSIIIKNFRQYKDIVFDFNKTTLYDLHVIIAVNGAGKTNLLNAINWCLYGDEPHTAGTDEQDVSKNEDKLVLANKITLQETKENGEPYCNVKVVIEGIEGNTRYTFEREAEIDVNALTQHGKDKFEVHEYLPTGTTNIYGSADGTEESFYEVRDILLPMKIREYFFFDGDQLLDYFGNNSAAARVSHLRSSIYEISQVSVVEQAREHLVEREKDVAKKIKNTAPNLTQVSDALENARTLYAQKENEIQQLKDQIELAQSELSAAEKALMGTETVIEDNERLNSNEEELQVLKGDLDEIKQEIAKFIRVYFERIMLYSINKDNDEYILRRLSEGSTLSVNIQEMKASLENDMRCALCGEPLKPERIKEFEGFLKKYESNLSIQKLSNIQQGVHSGLDIAGYKEEKKSLFDKLKKKESRIKKLNDENELLFARIKRATADIKELENIAEKKQEYSRLIAQNSHTLGKYEEQLVNLWKNVEAAEAEYRKAVDASEECKELSRRQRFLQKAIKIIIEVIDGIVSTVKKNLEEKTFEIFQSFIWDSERFHHIELDDYFRLKLFDAATMQSCLRSCSAGEKELLALAFTLAIHSVSGYDNLLFIDTPVGRLSGLNRSNFAEGLKDASQKKQIILAFTDTEFSEEVSHVFTDNIMSSKTVLDGELMETKRKGGAA